MTVNPETAPSTAAAAPRPSRTGWILAAVVSGLILVAVLLFLLPKAPEVLQAPPPPAGIPVTVTHVRGEDVREWVTYPGRVAAWSETTLAAEQPGRIVALPVDRGDRVEAGALLLRLDAREAEIQVRQQEVALRQIELDYSRLAGLLKSGGVATAEVDPIATRRDLTRIALDQARLNLEKCAVTNLGAGLILDRYVEAGEVVNPGQPLFKIGDLARVKILVDLPERDAFAVQPGQSILFHLDALPNRAFTGLVHYIASAADPLSNTFRAELAVDNHDQGLKPGLIARIRVDRGLIPQARVIPLQALIPEKGEYIAFQALNGHAVRRVVKLRALDDTDALIAEGLDVGDAVIVAGQRQVADGVAIIPEEEPGPRSGDSP